MKVAVIGGGAAGFFAAFSCKEYHPNSTIVIYEKSDKLLSKVKVSGGGRCNVTHACFKISELVSNYPRGEKQLKKAFYQFSTTNTIEWFEKRGVDLKTEWDNRMFPVTNNSQTIIDCFLTEARKKDIDIHLKTTISEIQKQQHGYKLVIKDDQEVLVDKIIIATGGHPKLTGYDWLKSLGHKIISPIPSLFTFNMPDELIKNLMGISVEDVSVHIQGTKMRSSGPLLITHWGMSGPAILRLSAFAAKELNEMNYEFKINVNWVAGKNDIQISEILTTEIGNMKKRKIVNANPFNLPNRLWTFLINKLEINNDLTWQQLGKKNLNRLIHILLNDVYAVKGKTTFKEEFVTCGGVDLSEVSFDTMQSKICPGMYFAGEVLDIDGVTGGFNFQAAWTTGYIAGKLQ